MIQKESGSKEHASYVVAPEEVKEKRQKREGEWV